MSRVKKVTDSCAVAASGDYADYQFLDRILDYLTYVYNYIYMSHLVSMVTFITQYKLLKHCEFKFCSPLYYVNEMVFVSSCVRACVRVCVCVRACMCACVCVYIIILNL